ncbi:MAG: zinc-binding dehydrogenase [Bdellovibrionota bacterium]
MKAAVFHKIGAPLTIETVPDPAPAPSDLVVKVKCCGICGSDLHATCTPPGLPKGTVMGHEFSGEVVEVGKEAQNRWRVGDRVTALPYIGCGTCEACLSGDGMRCARMKATGLGQIPGAYAEFVRVGSNETLKLPDAVSFQEGATVEPLSVGLHAIHKSGLRSGESVLIIGAGPIGLSCALWAKFLGARDVVVSERAPGRLSLAEKFGATAGIDASKESVGGAFHKIAGKGPDVIFECVGVPGLIQQCIALAPPRGRITVVGVCMQPDTIFPVLGIIKEISLHFVVGYRKSDFQFTLDMLAARRISSVPMITDTVGLSAFPEAFEALKKPQQQCKVMLEP